jgi:release factor glutamine methyltransferase
MARRRSKGEPLQYVLGTAAFKTEIVTERAIELLPHGGMLVDVGTGSGAIALAVASERPDASVFATEPDPAAHRWAVRNRDRLGLAVEIVQGDVFDGMPDRLAGSFDVVVSNPPYVSISRKEILPIDVRKHEPERALYGGGDGMAITSQIAEDARSWLKPGGWLVLEMGEEQQQAIRDLMDRLGYSDLVIGIDLAKWPRIAVARWTP